MKLGLFYFTPKIKYEFNSNYFPNNLGYIASYLEKYGNFNDVFIESRPNYLITKKPDIIGISSYTETFSDAILLSNEIKKHLNIPVIIGGHHISNLPHNLSKSMDIGVIGEGEEVMIELLNLHKSENLTPKYLRNIDGIVFHGENGLELTKPRSAINPIDKVPFPKRSLARNIGIPITQYNVMTSRGCPFTCIYCTAGLAIEKNRYHSTERVISEISYIMENYPDQKFISISDDLFAINKKRLKELCNAIRSEGLHKKIPFGCNARASVFDEEIAQILKDMNVKFVTFGLESGNERMLKYLKGASNVRKNQEALDICSKYNINTYTHFIIGSPTEKIEETADTYWFARRNSHQISNANIMMATPLPGTQFWKIALKENLIDKDFNDWEALNLWFEKGRSIYLNKEYSEEVMRDEVLPVVTKIVTGRYPIYNSKEFYDNLIQKNSITKEHNILEITNTTDCLNDYFDFKNYLRLKTIDGKVNFDFNKENKYDVILLINTINNFKDINTFLLNLKNIISKNSKIFILIKNPLFLPNLIKHYFPSNMEYKLNILDNNELHLITINKLSNLLTNNGFLIQENIPIVLPPDNKLKDYKDLFSNFSKRNQELDTISYFLKGSTL